MWIHRATTLSFRHRNIIAKNHDMPQTGFEKKNSFFRVHPFITIYIIAVLTQISPRYNIEFGGSHTSDIFDKLRPIIRRHTTFWEVLFY